MRGVTGCECGEHRERPGQGRAGQGIAGGEAGRLDWAVTQGVGVDVCMAR